MTIRTSALGSTASIRIQEHQTDEFLRLGLFEETDVRHVFMMDIDVVELEELINKCPHLLTLKVKSSVNYWSWGGSLIIGSPPITSAH